MTPREPLARPDDALYAEGKRLLTEAIEADPSLSAELERLMSLGLSERLPPSKPLPAAPEPQPSKPARPALRAVVLACAVVLAAAFLLARLSKKPAVPVAPPKSQTGKAGIVWVTIPGGTFAMGSEHLPDSEPRHSVTVKSFHIAKTEVTNKQYRACVEAGTCTPHVKDCHWSSSVDDQPVVCVDWNQAKAFAEWVGGRLPSEAEWEYAARSAGKERKYPWGDEEPSCERAVMSQGGDGCGRNSTWPVCSKTAGNTEQGLCDMAGNAWEWTQDWYHDSYSGAPTDGSAWESPSGSSRVYRGGSWGFDAAPLRVAYRLSYDPGGWNVLLGFRPAR